MNVRDFDRRYWVRLAGFTDDGVLVIVPADVVCTLERGILAFAENHTFPDALNIM